METVQIPLAEKMHLSTISPGNSEKLEALLKSSPGGLRLCPDDTLHFMMPDHAQYTLTELSEGVDGVIDLVISRSLSYLFVFDENACVCGREQNNNATLLLARMGYTSKRELRGTVLVIPTSLFV